MIKGGQPININKFNIFSNDFDCESTAVQFFMAFVIIPVGVGLPIAIASPVITMIGDGHGGDANAGIGWVGGEINCSHLEGERTATAIEIRNLIRSRGSADIGDTDHGKELRFGRGTAGPFLGNHDLIAAFDGA